jgi:PAS domain S-box-containing protein
MEAKTLLFGYDYISQRKIYLDSAASFVDKMQKDLDKQLLSKRNKDIASIFIIMFILGASVCTGFIALKQQKTAAAVAQLKRSQFALLTSASRLRQIIDNAPMPLLIANPEDNQVIVANLAFCELTGYTFEKLLNMKATDISAEPTQDIKDVILTLKGGEKTAKKIIKWKRSDGAVYDVVVSANMTEYAGNPVYLATAYDILERKHVETELKKHHVHIEDQVKKRTFEMENKMKELEKFHKASLEDETRIMALKKEIEDLKKAGGI